MGTASRSPWPGNWRRERGFPPPSGGGLSPGAYATAVGLRARRYGVAGVGPKRAPERKSRASDRRCYTATGESRRSGRSARQLWLYRTHGPCRQAPGRKRGREGSWGTLTSGTICIRYSARALKAQQLCEAPPSMWSETAHWTAAINCCTAIPVSLPISSLPAPTGRSQDGRQEGRASPRDSRFPPDPWILRTARSRSAMRLRAGLHAGTAHPVRIRTGRRRALCGPIGLRGYPDGLVDQPSSRCTTHPEHPARR